MKNLEFKVQLQFQPCFDFLGLPQASLEQIDTYFSVRPPYRLKWRQETQFNDQGIATSHSLIWYDRPNSQDQKVGQISHYSIFPMEPLTQWSSFLNLNFHKEVVVSKRRTWYQFKNARIHYDQIDGLATPFLEIEIVMNDVTEQQQAPTLLTFLREKLGLLHEPPVTQSYRELVLASQRLPWSCLKEKGQLYWVVNQPIRAPASTQILIPRDARVPCVFTERREGKRGPEHYQIQIDKSVRFQPEAKYTMFRKVVGQAYDIIIDVLLFQGEGLIDLQGRPQTIQGYSNVNVHRDFLCRFE